jgi:two-component system sensor histidine kinase UhpB
VNILFLRLLVINGLIFAVGTTVLALSPATVSSPVLVTELPVLTVGLALMVTANAFLLRASLAPLEGLTTLMERVDSLRSRDRLEVSGNGDLTHLIGTFNAMLDRLEADRSASTARVLAAQETERQRIARELHDEIGQSLTVVLLQLKRVVDRVPEELTEEVRTIRESVRSCLDEVRGVARRLRPGVLEDLGLLSALTALAAEFEDVGGLELAKSLEAPPDLDPDTELVIYRIAQESLTNVVRHSGARHARLRLFREEDGIVLEVSDDGCGPPRHDGAGILGMRERALLIGAELSITGAPVKGTRVRLVVPISRAAAA